jgi:hypothetical protein
VRDALSLSDQIISYVGTEGIEESKVAEVLGVADRGLTRTLVEALAAGDARTCLEAVDAATARGVDEVQIARAVVRYLRDLAVAKVAPDSEVLIDGSADERAQIKEQAASMDASRVRQMFDRMLRTCNELGETEQPRLVLDLGLIDVAATEPVLPLGDLLSRLSTMEARLRHGGAGGGGKAPSAAKARSATKAGSQNSPASAPAQASPASAPAQAQASARLPISDSEAPASADTGPLTPPSVAQASAPSPTSNSDTLATNATGPLASPDTGALARPAPAAPAAPAAMSMSDSVADTMPLPAPASLHTDSKLREWESLMNALEEANEYGLMTVYQTAKVLSWDASGIKIGFPAGGLTSEIAVDKEKIARMRVFIAKHVGSKLNFDVAILNAEQEAQAVSIIEDAKLRAGEEHERRLEEAKEHPMTKKVLRTFGAAIKEIKIENV